MNNFYEPEFYPTPPEVIRKMVEPYAKTLERATILEPSAGRGDILDYITNKGIDTVETNSRGVPFDYTCKANPKKVYAIEKNPDLQTILSKKGYRVIASDFLAFRPEHRFNLALMNPPFSNGETHLLHAWDILQGGDIACLLNAETVNNPFSASRKRLTAIIERHGSVEFIGQAFRTADNPTDVEIALVRLHKESEDDPFRIDFDPSPGGGTPDFGELASSRDDVAVSNGLDAYIRCWEKTKLSAVEFIRSFARFRFYAKAFLPQGERGENVMEMNGVLFDLSNTGLALVASDSHRLIVEDIPEVTADTQTQFILFRRHANLLKGLCTEGETVSVRMSATNAVFRFADMTLAVRGCTGRYPRYRDVIPKNNTNVLTTDRKGLVAILRRISVCANRVSQHIKVELVTEATGSTMKLTAEDLGFGLNAYEEMPIDYDGENMSIGFKASFLVEMLSNIEGENVRISLSDSRRAVLITPAEEQESPATTAILMPVMV